MNERNFFVGGKPMDSGYIYGSQNSPAYWTEDDAMVGTTFEFGPVDRVIQLRSSYGKRKLSERLVGTSCEDYPRGYLCRSCGKMLIDMAPAMIYYKDEKYLEAHPEDLSRVPADKEPGAMAKFSKYIRSFTNAFDDADPEDVRPAVRNVDGEIVRTDTNKVIGKDHQKKKKYKEDEPKRRSFFGRGPKVE